MSDFVFNIAKGRAGHFATLPAANDALIMVPIETSGIEADSVLKDYADLGSLLAAANNEQITMGRKTLGTVTSAVDNAADKWKAGAANATWSAPTGNAISKLIICYDPDTTTGSDSDLIPLVALDCVFTPAGVDFTPQFDAAGFYNAA